MKSDPQIDRDPERMRLAKVYREDPRQSTVRAVVAGMLLGVGVVPVDIVPVLGP